MSHEISQLDISGIQLRDSKTQPKVSLSREIGEAQIIHNIFGKAKVRIIRKHDTFWRSLWLALAFIVSATSTYLLQTWYATRGAEVVQTAASVSPPAPAAMTESLPQPRMQNDVASAVLPAGVAEPAKPAPVEVANPAIVRKPVTQSQNAVTAPAIGVSKPVAVPAKPVAIPPAPVVIQPKAVAATQPAVAGIPQTLPVGASGAVSKPQAIPPAVAKPIPPKQPVAPAAATVAVAKTVAAASSPAAAPVQGPQDKEEPAAPVAGKQLSSPVDVPVN